MRQDLARLFAPTSVAIVGASGERGAIGAQPVANLLNHRFAGRIYPVNPKYSDVEGLPCFPSIEQLPETPDVAVVVVGASRVPDALRAAARRQIPFAIVYASEPPVEGGNPLSASLQQQIADISNEYGIRVVGPNCQGLISVHGCLYAGIGNSFRGPGLREGAVSVVSQSGGFGFPMVALAEDQGIGFRHVVSVGNEAVLEFCDFVEFYMDDPGTTAIAGYIEGLRDPRRLRDLARESARRGKPILVWRAGRTDAGQKAAQAHTGKLGGSNELYRALFRDAGIIELEDLDDFVDYVRATRQPHRPQGNRIAIASASAGAGVVLADKCIQTGSRLPTLSTATLEELRQHLPPLASLLNPIDLTPALFNSVVGHRALRAVMAGILNDSEVDALVLSIGSLQGEGALRLATEIVAVSVESSKPLYVTWSARRSLVADALRFLDEACVPVFPTAARCAKAIEAAYWFAQTQAAIVNRGKVHEARISPAVDRIDSRLSEFDAKRLLAKYGIAITREGLARTEEEAIQIADRIGYPVAVKAQSADIAHKTEAGAVCLDITNRVDLEAAYRKVVACATAHVANAEVQGVLIQEMVSGARELIVGVINEPRFGPAVLVGLGGIYAEVLDDTSMRLAPVDREMALEMISELRGFPILNGARTGVISDLDAIADTIVRLSNASIDLRERVHAIDINPLFVYSKGRGVRAADALIVPHS